MYLFVGVLASLSAALCWTATAALLKIGSSKVQPLLANTVRVAAAAAGSMLLVFFTGEVSGLLTPDLAAFIIALSAGLLGIMLGDTVYIYALKVAGVARVMPVANTYPLFSTLGAFLFLSEKITLITIMGAIFIIFGLWLISPKGEEEGSFTVKSFSLTLLCALTWGTSTLLLGYALNYYSAVALNAVRLPFVALMLMGFAYFRGHNLSKLNKHTVAVLASAGILGLTIGNVLLLVGIDSIGVARAVPLSSTSPLFSTIVGRIFLHEKVGLKIYLSASLIVLGIVQITIG